MRKNETNQQQNISFNLEDLQKTIKMAQQIKEDAELSLKRDKMNNFERIIKGVSWKYQSKWVEREDLEQDLWVRVLELADDCGGIENTDERLVASICYKKAVDVYRYKRRRYEANSRYIEGFDSDEMDLGSDDYFDKRTCLDSAIDVCLFKEVIDLFDIGSRERTYIVIKLVSEGVIEREYLNLSDKDIKLPDGDKESDILKSLGYGSKYPGSWVNKKHNMKSVIKDFLANE